MMLITRHGGRTPNTCDGRHYVAEEEAAMREHEQERDSDG